MGSAKHQPGKCSHHWIIEPPDGATSMGVCKFCGKAREFFNILPTDFAAGLRKRAKAGLTQELVD
ncbi:MAG: hypothetical protein JRN35_05795 [Nitrososphaerota archaeon]|nr:hypothetical protein [Nitrososphaerota archaeon]